MGSNLKFNNSTGSVVRWRTHIQGHCQNIQNLSFAIRHFRSRLLAKHCLFDQKKKSGVATHTLFVLRLLRLLRSAATEQPKEIDSQHRALSIRPNTPVWISRNFLCQMEQHFPWFPEKRATSRAIPKFRKFPRGISKFSAEWFAFRKFNGEFPFDQKFRFEFSKIIWLLINR